MSGTFDEGGLARLRRLLDGHVAADPHLGLAWAVARGGEVHGGAAGLRSGPGSAPAERSDRFRIASLTKPVVGVAALALVEEGVLRLEDPVDALLPELADRRVLADPEGPLDRTVPAERPVTVLDLLSFRLGIGMDFTRWGRQPVLDAVAALGLGEGPPAPAGPPEPDEWLRRLGTLPLERQPGERWLYHLGAEVLGCLLARADGRPLDEVLDARVLGPLGMAGTSFWAGPEDRHRLGTTFWAADPAGGPAVAYDGPDGQWAAPPAFPSGGGGLLSTADDLLAFGRSLLGEGPRVLSRAGVAAFGSDLLTDEQRTTCGPSPDGSVGWGGCVGVRRRRTGVAFSVGTLAWEGGLGSTWAVDPAEGLVGVLLTTRAFAGPALPAVCQSFWDVVYAALP